MNAIRRLLTLASPKHLFTLGQLEKQLGSECDYKIEAAALQEVADNMTRHGLMPREVVVPVMVLPLRWGRWQRRGPCRWSTWSRPGWTTCWGTAARMTAASTFWMRRRPPRPRHPHHHLPLLPRRRRHRRWAQLEVVCTSPVKEALAHTLAPRTLAGQDVAVPATITPPSAPPTCNGVRQGTKRRTIQCIISIPQQVGGKQILAAPIVHVPHPNVWTGIANVHGEICP